MKKTKLEEKLNYRAKKIFENNLEAILSNIRNSKELSNIKFTIKYTHNGENKEEEVYIRNIFESYFSLGKYSTNFEDIEDSRIDEIERQQTEDLLEKLANIQYLFNQE